MYICVNMHTYVGAYIHTSLHFHPPFYPYTHSLTTHTFIYPSIYLSIYSLSIYISHKHAKTHVNRLKQSWISKEIPGREGEEKIHVVPPSPDFLATPLAVAAYEAISGYIFDINSNIHRSTSLLLSTHRPISILSQPTHISIHLFIHPSIHSYIHP